MWLIIRFILTLHSHQSWGWWGKHFFFNQAPAFCCKLFFFLPQQHKQANKQQQTSAATEVETGSNFWPQQSLSCCGQPITSSTIQRKCQHGKLHNLTSKNGCCCVNRVPSPSAAQSCRVLSQCWIWSQPRRDLSSLCSAQSKQLIPCGCDGVSSSTYGCISLGVFFFVCLIALPVFLIGCHPNTQRKHRKACLLRLSPPHNLICLLLS